MIEHHKDSADSKDRKPYCGLLYQQGLLEFTNDEATQRAFAAGFVSGQTEKVHSGSCPAAMFCPVSDDHAWFYRMVSDVARRYGLEADRLLVWPASLTHPKSGYIAGERRSVSGWSSLSIPNAGTSIVRSHAAFLEKKSTRISTSARVKTICEPEQNQGGCHDDNRLSLRRNVRSGPQYGSAIALPTCRVIPGRSKSRHLGTTRSCRKPTAAGRGDGTYPK